MRIIRILKRLYQAIIHMYDGIIIRSRFTIDKEFIDKAANLKFIGRVGAGLENIDVEYAHSKGIKLIAAPEGNLQCCRRTYFRNVISIDE